MQLSTGYTFLYHLSNDYSPFYSSTQELSFYSFIEDFAVFSTYYQHKVYTFLKHFATFLTDQKCSLFSSTSLKQLLVIL